MPPLFTNSYSFDPTTAFNAIIAATASWVHSDWQIINFLPLYLLLARIWNSSSCFGHCRCFMVWEFDVLAFVWTPSAPRHRTSLCRHRRSLYFLIFSVFGTLVGVFSGAVEAEAAKSAWSLAGRRVITVVVVIDMARAFETIPVVFVDRGLFASGWSCPWGGALGSRILVTVGHSLLRVIDWRHRSFLIVRLCRFCDGCEGESIAKISVWIYYHIQWLDRWMVFHRCVCGYDFRAQTHSGTSCHTTGTCASLLP